MVQVAYNELSDINKAWLFTGADAWAFPHNDPDQAIDFSGFPSNSTFVLDQYIDLINNSTLGLYFQITATILSGTPSAWSSLSSNAGSISPAGGTLAFLWQPKRTCPTSRVLETLRVKVAAYSDVSYSVLYGEDSIDFTYHFFSHSSGGVKDFTDFEEGSWEGWAQTSGFGTITIQYAYSGSSSVKMFKSGVNNYTVDSSGQKIPNQDHYISKTYDLSGYAHAYLVIHSTRHVAGSGDEYAKILRIWTSTKDFIIRVNRASATFNPIRIAVPLPCVNDTVKIASGFNSDTSCMWIDSIIITTFSS